MIKTKRCFPKQPAFPVGDRSAQAERISFAGGGERGICAGAGGGGARGRKGGCSSRERRGAARARAPAAVPDAGSARGAGAHVLLEFSPWGECRLGCDLPALIYELLLQRLFTHCISGPPARPRGAQEPAAASAAWRRW